MHPPGIPAVILFAFMAFKAATLNAHGAATLFAFIGFKAGAAAATLFYFMAFKRWSRACCWPPAS